MMELALAYQEMVALWSLTDFNCIHNISYFSNKIIYLREKKSKRDQWLDQLAKHTLAVLLFSAFTECFSCEL